MHPLNFPLSKRPSAISAPRTLRSPETTQASYFFQRVRNERALRSQPSTPRAPKSTRRPYVRCWWASPFPRTSGSPFVFTRRNTLCLSHGLDRTKSTTVLQLRKLEKATRMFVLKQANNSTLCRDPPIVFNLKPDAPRPCRPFSFKTWLFSFML